MEIERADSANVTKAEFPTTSDPSRHIYILNSSWRKRGLISGEALHEFMYQRQSASSHGMEYMNTPPPPPPHTHTQGGGVGGGGQAEKIIFAFKTVAQ